MFMKRNRISGEIRKKLKSEDLMTTNDHRERPWPTPTDVCDETSTVMHRSEEMNGPQAFILVVSLLYQIIFTIYMTPKYTRCSPVLPMCFLSP